MKISSPPSPVFLHTTIVRIIACAMIMFFHPPLLVCVYSLLNVTLRFCIPLSMASLTSSVCSMAAFHTAV
jgi:hypothetical protein